VRSSTKCDLQFNSWSKFEAGLEIVAWPAYGDCELPHNQAGSHSTNDWPRFGPAHARAVTEVPVRTIPTNETALRFTPVQGTTFVSGGDTDLVTVRLNYRFDLRGSRPGSAA
jgi:hypothetical protein